MSNILIGIVVAVLVIGLLAMAFRPVSTPARFTDADQDGEPDETLEEKRRALEADAD